MTRKLFMLVTLATLVAGCEDREARYEREYHQCLGEQMTDGGMLQDDAISACAELEAADRRIDGLRAAYRD